MAQRRAFALIVSLVGSLTLISAAPRPPQGVLTFSSQSAARSAHMTLRREGARLVVVDDASSRVLASADAVATNRVVIRGASGAHDDTLTIDVAGLDLAGGIDYDGGAAGWDTLVLRGDRGSAPQHVTQLSPTDGIFDLGGLQVRYFNLEPVDDTTTAASYTFNGTVGGEMIQIVDGPVLSGTQTTQINSGASASFELVNFANKTNVTVNSGGGADTFTVNNPNPAVGLTTMTLNGSADINTFNVTPSATVSYIVVGGAPVPPGTGDRLIVPLAGVTLSSLSIASDASGLQGTWSFAGRQPINFSQVETLNPADMYITKSGPATITAGGTATYTINVTNNGPSDAANVTVTDVLPTALTLVSTSAPAGFSCGSSGPGGGATVTCTTPVMLNGATAAISLVVRLDAAAPAESVVANTARVTTGTSEIDTLDNQSTTTSAVATSADLSVIKSGPATATSGGFAEYSIDVTNNGPSDASTITFNDTLPAGTTFASLLAPPGFSCTTPAVGGTGGVICTVPSLAAGATAPFTLVVNVTATAPATLTNTATVSAATADANAGNNTATATTTVVAPASVDLSITKTASPTTVTAGSNVTYTITVANSGPDAATGVTITDVLPAGSTFVSATPTQGTCSGTTTVTCSAGTLASGASMSIALVVRTPATPTSLANTASVTATETDSNAANNASTTTVTVTAIAAAAVPTLSESLLYLLGALLAAIAVIKLR